MHRFTQLFKLICINRVNSGKYHGFYLFKPFDRLMTWPVFMGDRIANLHFTCFFNSGNNVSHIPGLNHIFWRLFKFERAHFFCDIFFIGGNEFYFIFFADFAVQYFKVRHNPTERVKNRVKNEGLQFAVRITFWWWYAFYNCP